MEHLILVLEDELIDLISGLEHQCLVDVIVTFRITSHWMWWWTLDCMYSLSSLICLYKVLQYLQHCF